MKTTLSAVFALAAFAGSTLAQAGGPPWDRRIEATDVQLVTDSSGQTLVEVAPFVYSDTTTPTDISTVVEVYVNGSLVTSGISIAIFPPPITVGTCVDLICYWPCHAQGTQCRFLPYNGRCTCVIPSERVIQPMPVEVRDGDVITVQLSAAPGAVPEVLPDGDSVSFVARFPSGILHTPIGQATLEPAVGRRLPVRNLGSSGQDGVEVKWRTAQGGAVDIDMSHHFGPSNVGHSLRTRYKGWDGTIKGRYTAIATFSDGTTQDVSEECDFSPLGDVHVEMTCVSSTGVVTVLPIRESPTLAWTSECAIDPVSPPSWQLGARKNGAIVSADFNYTKRTSAPSTIHYPTSTGGVITVPDVVAIQCRPICIVAPCPGDWTNLGSMMIMSDTPELDVSNAHIKVEPCAGCPNGPTDNDGVYATGTATLAETQFDITGDGVPDTVYRTRTYGIGSSGQDGVEVKWPPATTQAREKMTNGHVTLMKAFDDNTGAERRMTVETDPLTGDVSLTPDNTLIGSTQTLVTAYDDNDNPVASFILAVGGVATIDYSTICPPGSFPTFVTFGNKTYFTGCQWIFDLVAPGGPTITNVHSVSFEALGTTVPFVHVTRTSHSTNDGEDIILGDLQATTGTTGPTCNDLDFNNDELFPDTADIDDFLTVFSGGPCRPPYLCDDIDFNRDGLFPDTTDIDSFLSVFSGGPCL